MGAYEVTYDEYQLFFEEEKDPKPKVDGITRPSPPYIDFTLGMGKVGGYPANSLQHYAALMYCKWLYKKTGVFYRLPTEIEWEYAATLGMKGIDINWQDTASLKAYAVYANNSNNRYRKVGQLKPNALGIYDMHGNVAEWTLDQYDETYYDKIPDGATDPVSTRTKRYPTTVKGGHYASPAKDLRPANRIPSELVWNRRDPQIPKSKWWNADAPFVGFRIVRPAKQPSKVEIEKFFEINLK
jgi:formylglycine-generating enzyme required for sulfatase activity